MTLKDMSKPLTIAQAREQFDFITERLKRDIDKAPTGIGLGVAAAKALPPLMHIILCLIGHAERAQTDVADLKRRLNTPANEPMPAIKLPPEINPPEGSPVERLINGEGKA